MRSKRFLAFLLAFCLVFTAMAPAASAVVAPELSVVNAEQNSEEKESATKTETSPNANGLIVSGEAAKGLETLRENPLLQVEVEDTATNDKIDWTVNPVEGKPQVSLFPAEAPECLAELREAAELFNTDDMVHAFVVMEGQALADVYTSRALVSADLEKQMIQKQDAMINSIEKTILGGEKLEVRYQFTYLTNAFTIKTAFGNLEKIAALKGVKSVFLTPVFDPCTTANPNTAAAGAMTGVHTVWEELGYTGTGMKIAIIDTGLDLDHPSFAADPETNGNSMTTADIAAVLTELNAYARRKTITADTLYRSAKVPFAFNYVDGNLTADHSRDEQGDHGTHVAGIAAANALDTTPVVGMAPDAQIIVMKVFGANGGAYMDDVAAALEDAMTLGCDVVNASLGSARGFSSSNSELDLIYERLASQDIVATFSAGNEGTSSYDNNWGLDLNRTQNPDNATVGSPSTWPNTLSIASAENCEIQTPFFTLADGTNIFFNNESYGHYYGYAPGMAPLIGIEMEYFYVDGLGYAEDFYDEEGNSLVEGKIALVDRGTLNFADKIFNAADAGAAACIIVNNSSETILDNFVLSDYRLDENGDPYFAGIPVCAINMEDGQKMAACETKTLTVSETPAARPVEGGQMSAFSSWGVTPDLQLLPDITGIGGNVYSCYDGGKYGLMSGTSMSAPQIAGVTALVMEYLHETYPDAAEGSIRALAEAIMMSTADPIISAVSGAEASPRQQGAGLINAAEALKATAYLTVGGGRPKAELGDNANGNYKFTFQIHNIGTEDKTYTMGASLLTEYVAYAYGQYFMYGEDIRLSGDVTFDQNSVTVPAGETANVTVSIALSDDDKDYFAAAWHNGGYVEGYVYLYNEEGVNELNLPFLGFYGDWTQAPIFDTAYWYDNSFWGVAPKNGLPEGDEYYHVFWTDLLGQDWVLGFNPYTGALVGEDGNIIYDPAYNVVSPNGDGILDGFTEIYLSLMRNAKVLEFNYTVDGEMVHQEIIENNPKTMYISNYGQIIPWFYSWYGWDMYDFTDAQGNVLPSGTEVLLTIRGYIDYGTGGDHTIQVPITVDTEAPELIGAYELPQEDGDYFLFVEMAEEVAPAAVMLMNPAGTQILAQEFELRETSKGNYMVGFDITDLGTEFLVALCDYAGNESYYAVKYDSAADGNLPNVDTAPLYGYRVYDDHLMSDHMFGWVSANRPADGETAKISVLTDDYLEYAAINAAEYVGGKIFAVDAVYNLVVLDPGLWNRKTVCNLGMNVMDMAFDDTTDTMYVLAKEDGYAGLYTMDLLTGETELVVDLGYSYYAPIAMTFDAEGVLYAVKPNSANLFTVDLTTGEMSAVTDAEGNTFVIGNENGVTAKPSQHTQAMTYSKEENTIYWSYLNSSWRGDDSALIAIDLTDLSVTISAYEAQAYASNNQLVTYYPATEIVGLMVLEATDYTIPEATALNAITLDAEDLVLNVGENATLTASANPWNYELGTVNWSSSDETVATVVDGKVVAIGKGTAVITASVGDLTAECVVNVIDVKGNFYAYNYYSGDDNYGYMIDVDMGSMNYTLVAAPGADFIAGDYNGHEDKFYGYTENGQFWSYDFETDETVALGAPVTSIPVDMAYDYSTGLMYAATHDYNMSATVLNLVDMSSGALIPTAYLYYDFLITLACDLEGNLYGVDYNGYVIKLNISDGYIEPELLIETQLGLQYAQSMCYDFNNDVLLWTHPESSQVYWMDVKADVPYAVTLGDPTDSGLIEFVGMFTIPEEMPALDYVAAESISASDMTMLVGSTKFPSISILPLNATNKSAELTADNASVVKVNEDGSLTAVGEGVATITGKLVDGENTFDISFTVNVIQGADDLYGHIMTDLATYAGQYWARIYPQDTTNPDELEITEYNLFAEEYYNGNLYAVGYDAYDMSGEWQMLVMDPVTHAVKEIKNLGMEYPFVYDMTYDYATSTMYCVAGPGDTASDLYIMDLETGALTLVLETEQFFMSLAASPDGTLYAMENSKEAFLGFDDYGWEIYGYTNAMLYAINPIEGTVELVGDTGVKCNVIASMSYDYDTDRLYWTPLYQGESLISGLAIVDPETAQATMLGSIGGGAQVSGLYILCDNFPEENLSVLHTMMVNPAKAVVGEGAEVVLNVVTVPMRVDVEIVWTSADESIATVDENGIVTGVAQGKTEITATVTYNGITMTDSCTVGVLAEDASFLTYNTTDMGWAAVSRADGTLVTNLTEGEEIAVQAIASANNEVYGYDVNNNLFSLNLETFERTILGAVDAKQHITDYLTMWGYTEEEIAEELSLYAFEVRDMAYDAANDRYLVLGNVYDAEWGEIEMGNGIYEVNLEDGSLTLLYTIEDTYSVMAMAVDAEGNVFYFGGYDDRYVKLDLTTGESGIISYSRTLGCYGSTEHDHAMYYDELTGKIYHAFTSNGTFYRLLAMDPSNGAPSVESEFLGEVIREDEWTYAGDAFAGLAFVELPEPEYTVEWVAGSATLRGAVGLTLKAVLSANIVNDPTAFVRFTYSGKTVDVPMAEAEVSVKDGVNRYAFSCEVFAKQFADTVTAQVMNENGPIGEAQQYSIVEYCLNKIEKNEDAELTALCKAMLNYGAAAQIMFNYNTDNLANASLSEADKVLADVDASAYKHNISGSEAGITAKSATLILESEVRIRIGFVLAEGADIADYTFTVAGKEVTPEFIGGRYYIYSEGIPAKDLDNMIEFKVGGLTVTYAGLSYVNSKLTAEDPNLVNMVKAVYAYYAAAEAFLG